jgi:hypothetical protein
MNAATEPSDYDSSVRCVDVADNDRVVSHGTGTSLKVPLTSEDENIVCTITNVNRHFGQLTVIKHLIPRHDSGRFNLLVNGDIHAHHVGDGGSTGPIPLDFGRHEVTEHAAAGTTLAYYHISTTCIDDQTGEVVAHNGHGPGVSVDLSRASDDVQCTISNERPGVKVARLEVVRHLAPPDDAGLFDLLVGGRAFAVGVGHNQSTGPLDFELGRHTVTEHAAGRTDLADFSISTTCIDRAHGGRTVAHNAHGRSVSVNLGRDSDNIVCTITNRRTAAPGEGGGEVPAPPGQAPHLSVTKTMPSHTHVHESVPVAIVVHNIGRGTAHGVQLHETPPAGMRVIHAADHGTILANGTVVWHLGSLAPPTVADGPCHVACPAHGAARQHGGRDGAELRPGPVGGRGARQSGSASPSSQAAASAGHRLT